MDLPSGDRLENIFKRQLELMEKYHPIEAKNGLLLSKDVPVDIDDKMGQARMKDMFWRFTEELGEAMDAFYNHPESFHEELSDALHFLVEACILAGIGPGRIVGMIVHPDSGFTDKLECLYGLNPVVSEKVGNIDKVVGFYVSTMMGISMAGNLLKNRPWKQSHTSTDTVAFKELVVRTFYRFITLCKYAGIMSPQNLYELYFKKSEVNKLRQSSNY